MCELIDLLVSDADMLPCEAAERISVAASRRVRGRTAADLMEPIPTITLNASIHEAVAALVEAGRAILAASPCRELAGVVAGWDITRAIAQGLPDDQPLEQIMTREVIVSSPATNLEWYSNWSTMISRLCRWWSRVRCWGMGQC